MTDYQEYDRDDKPVCKVLQRIPEMAKTRASGWGKVKIEVLLTDGTSDEITVDCRYYEGLRLNIFFMGQAQRDLAITFDAKDSTLRDGEGNQVACAVKVDGRNYLRTPTFNEMVQ
ncbi:uncharacterized protein N7483_001132 [Penicillium malachiteum]|uniref:uncharacterized protein n=1 Tax=Penicillium malachiteum TaxID=1324776 RepID=UPI0025492D6E|nr:uncharacterized protein N7483_001132 [Penicillium malachiteum]KAJ5736007.1 hypothetical protein N7483_001132 [Penicillium malachiteum]